MSEPQPRRRRRWIAWTVGLALYLSAALWSLHLKANESTEDYIPLYTNGVHVQPDGTVAAVPAHEPARYLPRSRVLAIHAGDPAAEEIAERHRDWLEAADLPGEGTAYEDLVVDALLDVHVLIGSTYDEEGVLTHSSPGAAVAAWTDRWRYVWPRDAAFIAVALAEVGHVEDAADVLGFIRDAVAEDGGFQARYLPDGSGVPDERGVQLDGNGWMLWAAAAVLERIEDEEDRALAFAELRPLVDVATENVLDLTDEPPHLPPPSPDYWEVREDMLTLGTVAPMLGGLERIASTYAAQSEEDRAEEAEARADVLRHAVETTFGPRGYERYAERSGPLSFLNGRDGRDAATAMLLRPFTEQVPEGAEEAWLLSTEEMARPAGGVAPGAGWRRDGITWTPQTTLYALTAAANGHPERAEEYLDWVRAHRTGSGAIPEKVLANGAPAAVAPLAWSSANVVLAVAALEEAA